MTDIVEDNLDNNNLWEGNENHSHQVYSRLKSSVDPEATEARKNIENLWNFYRNYADRNFRKEFGRDFYSRFWEMYLTHVLYIRGFSVKCPKPGPDILLKDNTKCIWVEAVAPKCGDEQSTDKIIDGLKGKNNYEVVVEPFKESQIIFRFRQAIESKLKKYQEYCKPTKTRGSIIGEEDPYIIAISGSNFPWSCPDRLLQPLIVKTVFPIGSLRLLINPDNGDILKQDFSCRRSVAKSSGSPVDTDIFLNKKYTAISGILYSRTYAICDYPRNPGSEFIFIHNPLGKNKLPYGFFSMGHEYIARIGDRQVEISHIDHNDK
jgi:hypothetical protein